MNTNLKILNTIDNIQLLLDGKVASIFDMDNQPPTIRGNAISAYSVVHSVISNGILLEQLTEPTNNKKIMRINGNMLMNINDFNSLPSLSFLFDKIDYETSAIVATTTTSNGYLPESLCSYDVVDISDLNEDGSITRYDTFYSIKDAKEAGITCIADAITLAYKVKFDTKINLYVVMSDEYEITKAIRQPMLTRMYPRMAGDTAQELSDITRMFGMLLSATYEQLPSDKKEIFLPWVTNVTPEEMESIGARRTSHNKLLSAYRDKTIIKMGSKIVDDPMFSFIIENS